MDMLSNERINVSCPKCGHKTQQTVSTLERNPNIKCPSCGGTIAVNATQLRQAGKEINDAVGDLTRRFKK
jgi:uncharacterized Zn finger protein